MRLARTLASGLLVVAAACGGDDSADDTTPVSDGAAATEEEPGTTTETAGSEAAAASGGVYDLPEDYPLPTPVGGTQLSALFDDAAGTSNVLISYPLEMLDALISEYDAFFDTVSSESLRVPLVDGIASWQNETSGFSVIVNGQNETIQVRLQTGI